MFPMAAENLATSCLRWVTKLGRFSLPRRWVPTSALVAIGALVAAPALAENIPAAELCPPAIKRLNRSVAYGSSDNVLQAPASAEERAALMAKLQSGEGQDRQFAIIRLGLAGDLEAFRLLLANRDIDGLNGYTYNYLNRDGSECIDPELENALLQHLKEPGLGFRLVALLGKNRYRSEAVLNALREIPFDPNTAHQWVAYARNITSTGLRVEAQVLETAQSLVQMETPVEKRVLPGLHRHYVQYFAARRYSPALSYFQALLKQASREESVQNFQIEFGMLRTVVQRGLAELDGAGASSTLIAELDAIVSKPLDPFSNNELYTVCQLVPSFTRANDKARVVELLERVLTTPQSPKYELAMRRVVYETLAKLGTPQSGALLTAELARHVRQPATNDFIVAKLFEALDKTADLDTTPVLALVDNFESPSGRRRIWGLVAIHPSAAGVDFLLQELRLAYHGGSKIQQLQGRRASTRLLNTLAAVESPEYQSRVRDGLDDLFDEGVLPERDYVSTVVKLNKALGGESPRYLAFRADQKRARQAQQIEAEQQGRKQLQAEFAEELVRHRTPKGIAENVERLSAGRSDARRGMQWLIIVGEPALPQLHAVLTSPATDERQMGQIMIVLGEIGSPSSVQPLIEAAQARTDGGYHGRALRALALLPASPKSIAFANAQLADGVPQRQQIAGLVYLAQIRHAPAAASVTRFTREGLAPRVRAVGFYLGARLGLPGLTAPIVAAHRQSNDPSDRSLLLQSLATLAADRAEFENLATSLGYSDGPNDYRKNLAYCAFRTASNTAPDEKVELAFKVLANGQIWHRREALQYLIATDPKGTVQRLTGGIGQFMPLHKLMPQSANVQLLFSEGRRQGYRLELRDNGYVLDKS
jgi:hypothetical protein